MNVNTLGSPKEIAEFLGVPVKTIYRWSSEGTGPTPRRVGKHLRYRWEDVFWFAFFHEAGHILLHRKKGVFIDGLKEGNNSVEVEIDGE